MVSERGLISTHSDTELDTTLQRGRAPVAPPTHSDGSATAGPPCSTPLKKIRTLLWPFRLRAAPSLGSEDLFFCPHPQSKKKNRSKLRAVLQCFQKFDLASVNSFLGFYTFWEQCIDYKETQLCVNQVFWRWHASYFLLSDNEIIISMKGNFSKSQTEYENATNAETRMIEYYYEVFTFGLWIWLFALWMLIIMSRLGLGVCLY